MTFRNWLVSLWVDYKVWRHGPPQRVCPCGCGKPEVQIRIVPDDDIRNWNEEKP